MSFQNAFLGSLVGDAVSMPVHWYYNTDALDRTTAIFRITWLQNLIIQTVFYGDRSVILLAEKMIFITTSQDIGG